MNHENARKMKSVLRPRTRGGYYKTITEKVFVTWSVLNWRGKIVETLRLLRQRLGFRGEMDSLFFAVDLRGSQPRVQAFVDVNVLQ